MISLTAEHALRAVVHLATHPGGALTVEVIAHGTGVPAGSLAKILQQLCRAGLASSQRGPNGGFTLLRSPQTLTLLEVILASSGTRPAGRPSPDARDALGRHLDDTRAQIEAAYHTTTIARFLHEEVVATAATPLA